MKQDESTIKQEDSIPEDSFLPNEREGEFFYRFEAKSHLLNAKQYIYYLGPYRYNWHYDIEIMLVLEGKIEVNYGGKTVFLEQDDLLILTPNEGHATLAKSTSSKAMLLRVNPDYLKDYYAPIRNYYFSGNTDEKNRNQLKFVLIRGILANMISHIGSKDPLVRLKFESELNHLLSLLFDAFPPKAKNSASDEKKIRKDDELIRKIVRYIESHYQEKISLSDLGRLCSYNLSYLSLFFKKHVGINFYEYLMRIRLREATLELCTSNENVIEIASKHGFPDLKSFNYNFKKTFNKSPREYRQQLLEENKGMDFLEKRKFVSEQDRQIQEKLQEYRNRMERTLHVEDKTKNFFDMDTELYQIVGYTEQLRKQVEETVKKWETIK